MDARKLEDILRHDFSAGTERFADQLLAYALAAIGTGEEDGRSSGKRLAGELFEDGHRADLRLVDEPAEVELADESLEWLAAAGQPETMHETD